MPTLQWPEPQFVDGDFSIPTACSLPVFSSPIPSTTDEYLFTQEWMQARADFVPTPLNSAHPSGGYVPDYSDFRLVAEGPRQDVGGGMVKWTRTYARVPASHDEWDTYGYSYIGYFGLWFIPSQIGNFTAPTSNVNSTGRPRSTQLVTSRIHHDYFLTGSGGSYATPSLIPIIKRQHYYGGATPGPATGLETDLLVDSVGNLIGTLPTKTTYLTWVANAKTYGFAGGVVSGWIGDWSNLAAYAVGDSILYSGVPYICILTVTPPGSGPIYDTDHWAVIENPSQLIAEDSRLVRWFGNIYQRSTRFVLAQ